jgi:AbrB family looped-hinge helix DNA binding protein
LILDFQICNFSNGALAQSYTQGGHGARFSEWERAICDRGYYIDLCYTFLIEGITEEIFMTLTVSNKGWIVIPAELRKKYHLTPGTEVVIVDYGGVLAIIPAMKDPINQSRGMLKNVPSLTEELLKERAAELEREEAKIKRLNG